MCGKRDGPARAPCGDMECCERARLLGAYNRAALAMSLTVDELPHGVGVRSSTIFGTRRYAAGKARVGLELAGRAYEIHVGGHGCETSNLVGTKAVNNTVAEGSTICSPHVAMIPADNGFDPLGMGAALRHP
jgi:hypothetical protein